MDSGFRPHPVQSSVPGPVPLAGGRWAGSGHTSESLQGDRRCANRSAQAEPLRILTYDVLYGFNHGKAPEIGAKWIAEQKPDIVALQELNGFKQGALEKIAKKWNHDHAIMLKEKGFPAGLTADSEITVIEKRLEGMWHGYLHCKIKGAHIFVVHLSPFRHAFRMKEASLVCAKAKPLLEAAKLDETSFLRMEFQV